MALPCDWGAELIPVICRKMTRIVKLKQMEADVLWGRSECFMLGSKELEDCRHHIFWNEMLVTSLLAWKLFGLFSFILLFIVGSLLGAGRVEIKAKSWMGNIPLSPFTSLYFPFSITFRQQQQEEHGGWTGTSYRKYWSLLQINTKVETLKFES